MQDSPARASSRPPSAAAADDPHATFAESRRQLYVEHPSTLEQLDRYADHGIARQRRGGSQSTGAGQISEISVPFVITGESGSGKSALLAHWAARYRQRHPDIPVIEHYVGADSAGESHIGVIRHIVEQIRRTFSRAESIPTTLDELERNFGTWLARTGGGPAVFVIDGLNQLDASAQNLAWLPRRLPANVRLLLSATDSPALTELSDRDCPILRLQPLAPGERIALAEQYLTWTGGDLTPEQLRRITVHPVAGNPLFLRTQLVELNVAVESDQVKTTIEYFTGARDLDDLFDRILLRVEDRLGPELPGELLLMLLASHAGVSAEELGGISGRSPSEVAPLTGALANHLTATHGLLGFYHERLRGAISRRYTGDPAALDNTRRRIVRYFEALPLTVRAADELAWQLHALRDWSKLSEHLGRLDVLEVMVGDRHYELLQYWRTLSRHFDIEQVYHASLAAYDPDANDPVRKVMLFRRLGQLFEIVGRWDAAEDLFRRELAVAAQLPEGTLEFDHASLGWVLYRKGEYDEALRMLEIDLGVAERHGNRGGISRALNLMGSVMYGRGAFERSIECFERTARLAIEDNNEAAACRAFGNLMVMHAQRGEYDRAEEYYHRKMEIVEVLGDTYLAVNALNNMGMIHEHREEFDDALRCFERALEGAVALGSLEQIANATGNAAVVHRRLGDFATAREYHMRQLEVNRQLGNRRGTANALGDLGIMYNQMGEYPEAMRCYREQLEIARQLGDQSSVGTATGNIGNVYRNRGKHARALECFARAEKIHRSLGYLYGVSYWIEGRGGVLLEIVRNRRPLPGYLSRYAGSVDREGLLRQCIADAGECVEISDRISKPDTSFNGRVLLARARYELGECQAAIESLQEMTGADGEAMRRLSDEQRAELELRLAELLARSGDRKGSEQHGRLSVQIYRRLQRASPKISVRRMLEELGRLGFTDESE